MYLKKKILTAFLFSLHKIKMFRHLSEIILNAISDSDKGAGDTSDPYKGMTSQLYLIELQLF